MSKIYNLRKLFALIGAGITIMSFSGCYKNKKEVLKGSVTSISSVTSEISNPEEDSEEYWWPVGSVETFKRDGKLFASGMPEETVIVNKFLSGDDIFKTKKVLNSHSGIDIVALDKERENNVIASKSGIVVFPSEDDRIDYHSYDKDASGYGNYVIIQHEDGNYTLYAHLKENTISVRAGQKVEQGQIIGKIGDSGNCISKHLHFELRYGENKAKYVANPEYYVSMDNPRIIKGESVYDSDDITYYSRDELLNNTRLVLNTCNDWELKVSYLAIKKITNESVINYLNEKAEQLGTREFSMSDLEEFGIKESVLYNRDLEMKQKVMY